MLFSAPTDLGANAGVGPLYVLWCEGRQKFFDRVDKLLLRALVRSIVLTPIPGGGIWPDEKSSVSSFCEVYTFHRMAWGSAG